MPGLRTELSDGTIRIRAYERGIELAVFEAARESVPEVGPWMRKWRDGATYAQATLEGVLPAGPHGQGELENVSYCFALDRPV